MKRKVIVFFICLILLLTSYPQKESIIIEKHDNIVEEIKEESNQSKKVSLLYNDNKISMDLEDYVIGVVSCEVPISFEEEALKAMSVAARTFALYKIETNKNYVLKTDTSDQCYNSIEDMKKKWKTNYDKNYNKIKDAVEATKGEYMTYKDKVIIAFYFSISNGYTENCEDVFTQKLDYLVSVDSSWDKEYEYKMSTKTIDISTFLSKLNISEQTINNIKIERSATGRINYITINSKKFKGTKFRQLLGLKSTDIEITNDSKNVYIKTKGYGHGVGMSQLGSNVMAKKGYKYEDILKYYYTGIKIVNN
jgi:stage II sporulation protein D